MSSYHLKRKKISVKRKKNRQKTNCLSNSGSTIASANTTASIKLVAATAVSHNSWLKLKLFRTHKIVLARSSDVFERMISKEWCGDGMVCLNFVISRIIPQLTLKEVFHVWFQYGTKCFHQALVKTCVDRLATQFQDIISGQEWEKEWLLLDKDQMNEFLRTSELTVASEYEIWLAVFRWIQNLIQSEKRSSVSVERILGAVLPNIRFPMMTADELNQVEKLPFVEQHAKYFQPYLMMSYKYRALPLISRAASREFCGSQFLLRNYTRLRWDKRFVIADFSSLPRYSEISFKANTCGSTLPPQPWDWELKLHPKGVSGNCDEFKCVLVSSVMLDQSRAVEYMLSIVNDKMILRSIVGKKIFSKSRYGSDLELEKRVAVDEVLMENSPLLINDTMVLQLTLRPIE
ncbi:BTB/POZ domain-containing protein 17 [Trichinella pseudospiralis]|uniref:BTB/POZ domain-containing protein 17 n=1 Tax=Trichinella pseudospiralis TaxID=6337 RepID=A0A0V0Y7D3_TRIPS|nr:BTB/POZ domain-containing protein 17 [Trichinella pseudospiralis]